MLPPVRCLVLFLSAFFLFACEDDPAGPPAWPALEGETPNHGLEQLELRTQKTADEASRVRVVLRRDGCVRRETTEGEGPTLACTACSDDQEAVDQLFVDAKSREVVTVLATMGKSLAPPIAIGDYHGYLFIDAAQGQTRRGSGGDEVIERIARQLFEGVPGAPELSGDRCAEVTGEGE